MVSYNGSADLRSPEKEVYFRSWDFANSQMCEVRVATSNICGCNPPNRCGERSGADFATSFWVLPKAGFLAQKLNRRTNVEPCTNAQLKPFSPAFGNTLLAVRAFVSLFNSTVVFIFLSIFCLFVELSKLFIKSC